MNAMVNMMSDNSEVTMTSTEIASLLGAQHGNVRISIERLAKKNVIQLPPTQLVENLQSLSPNNKTQVYVFSGESGKRDSIIVVAQLSPEFTAKLVDRWKELEDQVSRPATLLLNDPHSLRSALLVYTEKVIELEHKVEEDRPKVEFHDHVTASNQWLDMSTVAKVLDFVDIGRNKLFEILRKAKVLTKGNEPYQVYVDRGYFKQVVVPYGTDKVTQKTVVSYKGVEWIRKNLLKYGAVVFNNMTLKTT